MAKKVILIDNDEEELIPYTELATNNSAGRIRPDNSTVTVDGNGVLSVNGVTGTELGYLSGVTSSIQTQINSKVQRSGSETISGIKTFSDSPIVPSPNNNDDSQQATNTSWVNAKIDSILGSLYPVGSIYIGTQSTCPLEDLISGSTWELVAENRALWGGDGTNANTTIAAGLPNITATNMSVVGKNTAQTGAVIKNSTSSYVGSSSSANWNYTDLDASLSSSIYGNSDTVQPPAYVVNIWRRTA